MKIEIAPGVFRELLRRALVCASSDETREPLCGVLLETDGANVLRAVATDDHRLCALEAPCDVRAPGSTFVPLGAAEQIIKALPKASIRKGCRVAELPAEVLVEGETLRVVYAAGSAQGECRAPDDFPPWRHVLPEVDREARRAPFGIRARYLADAGELLSGENAVTIEAGGVMDQILLTGDDATWGIGMIYVVMPVRL